MDEQVVQAEETIYETPTETTPSFEESVRAILEAITKTIESMEERLDRISKAYQAEMLTEKDTVLEEESAEPVLDEIISELLQ